MDTLLIAKVLATDQDGDRNIGTGYPIADGLVITARHVVVFAERDCSVPITLEWPDLGLKDIEAEIIYDGGSTERDIAVLKGKTSPDIQLPPFLLARRMPIEHEPWATHGYPRFSKTLSTDGKRQLTSAMGTFYPPDQSRAKSHLKSEGNPSAKGDWGGASGAPVFQGNTLYGVISTVPTQVDERFTVMLIPWLLANDPGFSAALGLEVGNGENQVFFQDRCEDFLKSMGSSLLYTALATKFEGDATADSKVLFNTVNNALKADPIDCLEKIRLTVEPVIRKNAGEKEDAQQLFCLILGLYASGDLSNNQGNLHELAAKTRAVVEIELAANYQLPPDPVVGQNNEILGRYVIEDECFAEVGWQPEANAEMLSKVAYMATKKTYKKVHSTDPAFALDELDREDLNATIRTRRKSENNAPQLIRFEVMMREHDDNTHPLLSDAVCKVLHSKEYLPDLPVVRFGLQKAEKEGELRAQIREFFRMLEECK